MIVQFLATGFEETEALCPLDLLRRTGCDVKTVAIGVAEKVVVGSHGIPVCADLSEAEFLSSGIVPAGVILPGGLPGATNLDSSSTVDRTLRAVREAGGILAAICAAPMVLGKRGYLAGHTAICYPGYEKDLVGAKIADRRVVIDGKVVTGAGMGVSTEFGLALVKVFAGDAVAEKIRRGILAD